MTKKLFLSFAIIILLVAMTVGVVAVGNMEQPAEAATVSWTARVAMKDGEKYLYLNSGARVTETSVFYLLVSDYAQNDSFEYFVSSTRIGANNTAELSKKSWTSFDVEDKKTDNDNNVCWTAAITTQNKDEIYVYFRREYTDPATLMTTYEYYSSYYWIIVNVGLTVDDLGIDSIRATYTENNRIINYTGQRWVGTGLTFTVVTKHMNNLDKNPEGIYDSSNELLSYSVDGKEYSDPSKSWISMNTNSVTIKTSINNGRVDFRVTDIASQNPSYRSFDNVKIDMASPVFNLTATTRDFYSGNVVPYQNRTWASADVTFAFEDVSDCISGVSYYFSEDGINYVLIPDLIYVVRNTTRGLRFRAVSGANVIADYNEGESFSVNIDPVLPGVVAEGYTDDPDNIGSLKKIPAVFNGIEDSYQSTADANGQFYLNIYNKDKDDNFINNASGVKFMYSYSVDGGAFTPYREATNALSEDGNVYYRITDSISRGVASDRVYKFYVVSGAGLRSNETTYTVKILNSVFEIEVQDIKYTPNSSGWSATPIPVYVVVPTDSKAIYDDYDSSKITGYTDPTTKYTFVYSPTNISGLSYEVEGTYYKRVEGDKNYPDVKEEEGKSVYRFMLSASAESPFFIYAKNGAGKRSSNDYTSGNVIKIDVIEPQVEMTAYIKDSNRIYVSDGDWVNGRIILNFMVKDGVSGIIFKDMVFAANDNGDPIYNSAGELIWHENSAERVANSSLNSEDGSRYFVYSIEIGLPNASTSKMSREYRFRVYTGSGVYTEMSFVANIDTSDILLQNVEFLTENGTEAVEVDQNRIVLSSICNDATVKLFSNTDQEGHFDYYVFDDVSNSYVFVEGNELKFSVPADRKGEIVKKLYLVSRAKDSQGMSKTTNTLVPYEIVVPYNTLNISINYELKTDTFGLDSKWVDSNLIVQIGLVRDDEGTARELSDAEKRNYSYYYMLIDNTPGLNLNEAIRTGDWIFRSGNYIEIDGTNVYTFEIDFTHDSFYGYIALSVTNEAGFRSSTTGDVNRLLYIDRTTPALEDMIVQTSGISESKSVEGVTTVTYYSKDEITIVPKEFSNRSEITYYYIDFSEEKPVTATQKPTSTDSNGWKRLDQNIVLSAEGETAEYYFIFYAKNELGAEAGGITGGTYSICYKFVIDKAEMTGTLSYNANDGGYFDKSINMYAYIWQENVNITLFVEGSNTEIKYYFSMDDGFTWEAYREGGRDEGYEIFYEPGISHAKTLYLGGYFKEGVNSAFTFKAVNKAGTEYIYGTKIYIAIDTMTPEFSVSLTVDGVEYNGGGTDLSYYSAANWSNRPVTITINPIKVNVSGVIYTYTIEYLINKTPQTTTERETPSNVSFTTDRLDGFGINRDAVITIRATSRSDKTKYSEVKFRVKVDQIVPEFALTGRASNDDNTATKTIYSGDWTNYSKVEISKASDINHTNVSNVTYTYTYKDLESTGITEHNWPEGNPVFNKICTITVTAISDAGLSYSEEFKVNIDQKAPIIRFMRSESISIREGEEHFIDLKVYVEEENIEICEYITIKGDTRGFALDPTGYIISTSSVDNTIRYDPLTKEEYRGYVKIYVKDYAGNTATFEFYMLPFKLDVNNVTLKDSDQKIIDGYESDLNAAESYMEAARVTYFRNLISRLKDRINTLHTEINAYRAYLEKLAQRTSFELKSDYWEMFSYLETYNNYEIYGQKWIQDEIKGDASSSYYRYFENLLIQFASLQKLMDNVISVQNEVILLPAINMVEADDYNDVLRVYDHYSDLSSDQKASFTTNLYTKLLALKKRCEILLLADAETGVALDASFAPGAKIKVETFSSQSEYYVNAQAAILSVISDVNASRAVVSIYRIGLTGAASQTSTGEITVTLPIPEDFRQYTRFAVYEMSTNGTVTTVDKVTIAGDGKSVTFKSPQLTTYVLATKANIQENEQNTDNFGTFLGLDLDVEMVRNLSIIAFALFAVVIVVVIIAGIRHRRFLNTYNRAYKSGIYRRGIQRIPKGNTRPRINPKNSEERVKDQKKPY